MHTVILLGRPCRSLLHCGQFIFASPGSSLPVTSPASKFACLFRRSPLTSNGVRRGQPPGPGASPHNSSGVPMSHKRTSSDRESLSLR